MKIGIIGFGFVGKALSYGINDDVEQFKVDPKLNTKIQDLILFNPELVFISVPTPMNDDGTQDISILKKVFKELNEQKNKFQIVIKSTILPSSLADLSKINNNFVLNPEFLREKYANEDFINSSTIIFGGEKTISEKVSDFYKKHTKCVNQNHIFTDIISASLIKYSINSFLATKVIFFNELHKIFNISGSNDNWKNFVKAISTDKRIGSSHMDVPGHDLRLGFGGPCFPKDTRALYEYSKEIDSEFKLLLKAIEINNSMRSEYNGVTEREKEQNINFTINGDQ
jgi:UDPglucose 6-dehydrogenase